MLTNITLAYLTSHLLLWGLPLAFPEHRQTFQLSFMYAMAGFLLVYCVVLHWICALLRSCFMQLNQASSQRNQRRSVRFDDISSTPPPPARDPDSKFSQAYRAISKVIWLNRIVGALTAIALIVTAALPQLNTNMYIVYGAAALISSIYTVVNTMVFLGTCLFLAIYQSLSLSLCTFVNTFTCTARSTS
jgi:hypothetical protein